MVRLNKETSQIPLYVQLAQILRSAITTGHLGPDDRIPTEKELATAYGVSVATARQATLELVREGLLVRQQGRGTFVRQQEGVASMKNIMTFDARGDINQIIPETLRNPKIELLDVTEVRLTSRLKEVLNLTGEDAVLRIRRTRSEDDTVFSYVVNFLPLSIGRQIDRDDLIRYSMLHILLRKLHVPVKNGVQYITAVVADYDAATALRIGCGSPLLYLETVYYNERDEAIAFGQTFYRSDCFKYTLRFGLTEGEKQ